MKDKLNTCNLYTLLWCIYYFEGATTTEGSMLGRLSLFGALAISFYCFYLCLTKLKLPRYFKGLNTLVFMLSVYGAYRLIPGTEVNMGFTTVARFDYLKNILMSILPIYAYYYFAAKGFVDRKWLMTWSLIFIALAIYSFFGYSMKRFSTYTTVSDLGSLDFTNNTAYLFVNILPILFFFRKRPIIQYSLFFGVAAFTFFGMKRGAIIIMVVCLLFYMLKSRSKMSSRTKYLSLIISILFIAVGVNEFLSFYSQSDYFQLRTEETVMGESSHRDELYSTLFSYYFNQPSIVSILLGNGANATITIAGNPAHNDWLEILINQGALGFLIFLNYWYVFFLTCKKAYRKGKPDETGLALIAIFFICFFKSIFSMSINDMNIFITSALGFCLYNLEISNKTKINVECYDKNKA